MSEYFYKVLWIDDEPSEEFLNMAYEKKIEIKTANSFREGLDMMDDLHYAFDAIILDAYCPWDKGSVPKQNVGELNRMIRELSSRYGLVPWFIFTAAPPEDVEKWIDIVCPDHGVWAPKTYYSKNLQEDRESLFKDIKNKVDDSEETKIKMKYSDVLGMWSDKGTLLGILKMTEGLDYKKDNVFNDIRKMLEKIMHYCYECCVLPFEIGSEYYDYNTSLNNCSRFLCLKQLQKKIPEYIQNSLKTCVMASQSGSHVLNLTEDVKNGKAPYIVRSTIFELLNVIIWCKTLPKDEESRAEWQELTDSVLEEHAIDFKNKNKNKNKIS
jgi:hypothetical protein